MDIRATRIYHGEWIAVDDDIYDGAPDSKSLCGVGPTEAAAIDDLLTKMAERYGPEERPDWSQIHRS